MIIKAGVFKTPAFSFCNSRFFAAIKHYPIADRLVIIVAGDFQVRLFKDINHPCDEEILWQVPSGVCLL